MATTSREPLTLAALTGTSCLELLWLQAPILLLTCTTFGLAGNCASFSSKSTGNWCSLPLLIIPLAVATLKAGAKDQVKRSLFNTAEATRGKVEEDAKQ